jgi:hypothetical protein
VHPWIEGIGSLARGNPTFEPPVRGGQGAATARSSLVQGLHTVMLIAAIVSFAAAVVAFVLIRERDFVAAEEGEEEVELAVAA